MDINQVADQLRQTAAKGSLVFPQDFPVANNGLATIMNLLLVQSLTVTTQPDKIKVEDGTRIIVTGTATLFKIPGQSVTFTFTQVSETQYTTVLKSSIVQITIQQMASLGLIPMGKISDPGIFPTGDFASVNLDVSSSDSLLTLDVRVSVNVIFLFNLIGLTVERLGFTLSNTYDAFSKKTDSQFTLSGDLKLGETEVTVAVTVPVNSFSLPNVWNVTLTSGSSLTQGLGDLSRLFIGTNILELLPTAVSNIGSKFGISKLSVTFDPAAGSMKALSATLESVEPWDVVPGKFLIEKTGATLDIQWLDNQKQVGVSVFGDYKFNEDISLGVNITIPGGKSDWVFSMNLGIETPILKELSAVETANIPGGMPLASLNLPAKWFEFKGLDLNEFTIAFNPSNAALTSILIDLEVFLRWVIVEDILEISDPKLFLNVLNPLNSNRQLAGFIGGSVEIVNIPFEISLAKEDFDADWILRVATPDGESFDLKDLTNQFLKPLNVSLPESIFPSPLGITGVELTMNVSTNPYQYTLKGGTAGFWKFKLGFLPEFSISGSIDLNYSKQRSATNPWSGTIRGRTLFLGFDIEVIYTFSSQGAQSNETITIVLWEKFKATYKSPERTITIEIGDWSLGEIITNFIRAVSPYSNFTLPSPWDILNTISLKGLSLKIDLNTNQVTVHYKLPSPIKLGFININGITLGKENGQVTLSIDGSSPIQDINNSSLFKPAGQNVQQMPAVPGQGTQFFDLRLLALGQRVGVKDMQKLKTVSEVIAALRGIPNSSGVKPPVPNDIILFKPESNWLIAMNFGLMRVGNDWTAQISAVFNDPDLYGLRIEMAGAKAKIFAGLKFEILYRKISDSVGVFKIELALPDSMRYLQFSAVTIILPVIAVEVYTNGDFFIDLGFPYKLDFTRSFTIEAIIYPGIPVLGSGGLYFGKLSSATTNKVPASKCGDFNPVIVFGIGMQLGLGKSINAGVFKAGFSITMLGIIEGVIASWNPYNGVDAGGAKGDVEKSYYYWLKGTLGLMGKLYGSVDFGIIQAEVNLEVYVTIDIVLESYAKIPITLSVGVKVSVSLKINLGLFSIKISFSFNYTIKATLDIGTDRRNQAPWFCGGAKANRLAASRGMRIADYRAQLERDRYQGRLLTASVAPNWKPYKVSAKTGLPLYFAPNLSIMGPKEGDLKAQAAQYVSMLFTDSRPAGSGETTPSAYGLLAENVVMWTINSWVNQANPEIPVSQLLAQPIAATSLVDLFDYLSDPAIPVPIPSKDIQDFLKEVFMVTAEVLASEKSGGAVFPVVPGMGLNVPKFGSVPEINIQYDTYTGASDNYIKFIREWFDQLKVKVQEEMGQDARALMAPAELQQSIASFVFEDFFLLIARQGLQYAMDAMEAFAYPLTPTTAIQDVLNWANGIHLDSLSNILTGPELVEANNTHPLTAGKPLKIWGLQYQVQPLASGLGTDSLDTIARSNTQAPAFVTQVNAQAPGILVVGTEVKVGEKTYVIQSGDTLQTIATALQIDLDALSVAILHQNDIFEEGSFVMVAGLAYQLKNEETLDTVKALYPVTTADIGKWNALLPNLVRPGTLIELSGNTHEVTSADTLQSIATTLGSTVDAVTTAIAGSNVLMALTSLMVPPFDHQTLQGDTFTEIANRYHIESAAIARFAGNYTVQGLFSMDGDPENQLLRVPDLILLTVKDITDTLRRTGSLENLAGMSSRYALHGLRLPKNGELTLGPDFQYQRDLPNYGLYQLTGQQWPLPTLTVESDYKFALTKTDALSWITFKGATDPKRLELQLDKTKEIPRILDVLGYAQTSGLKPKLLKLAAMPVAQEKAAMYVYSSAIPLQAAGKLSLPYGISNETNPKRYIWNFSPALAELAAQKKVLLPKMSMQVGTYDRVSGKLISQPANSYGWGTLVNFTVKQMPNTQSLAEGGPFSYELMGSDAAGIAFLERLLQVIRRDDPGTIQDLVLLYPPNPTGSNSSGLQTDGNENITAFITQSSLSTETNPPVGALPQNALLSEEPSLRGILNSKYDFIRLLWQCSITRSGGYALYYQVLVNGTGLPESIFDDEGVANMQLLVIYPKQVVVQGDNLVHNFMNVAVTADNIDPAQQVVFAQSEMQSATLGSVEQQGSLRTIAAGYHASVGALARLNARQPLTAGKGLRVRNIYFEVPPVASGSPQWDLARLVTYFQVQPGEIKALNPEINFDQPLKMWTLVHIPDLDYSVSPGAPAKDQFQTIADYYFVSIDALAVDNQDLAAIFSSAATVSVSDQVLTKTASVSAGNVGFEALLENPGEVPSVADPSGLKLDLAAMATTGYAEKYLLSLFNLLDYAVTPNASFTQSITGLPAGPTDRVPDTENQRLLKSTSENTTDPLEYRQVVPISRYARFNSIPETTNLPPKALNPYAGVGAMGQVHFGWNDLYGNQTQTPLSNPQMDLSQPVNDAPVFVGYTDKLMGIETWPSLMYDYRIEVQSGVPTLIIDLRFDTSRYEEEGSGLGLMLNGAELTASEEHALLDLKAYTAVYYQLNQMLPDGAGGLKPAITWALVASLLKTPSTTLDAGTVANILAFVNNIYIWLDNRSRGIVGETPVMQPITLQAPLDQVVDADLFELRVALAIRRPDWQVAPELRDTENVTSTAAFINPRTGSLVAGDEPSTDALLVFAQQFEAAYRVPGLSTLKVATTTNKQTIGTRSTSDVYVVRFSDQSAKGIYYQPAAGSEVYYAQVPLANHLESRAGVPIAPYIPGTGIDWGQTIPTTLNALDLDDLGRQFSEAVDLFLTPEYANAAFIVDKLGTTGYLQAILESKKEIAGHFANRVIPIFEGTSNGPEGLAEAREKVRQKLLIQLGNSYYINAVVQYKANVSSGLANGNVPPRLFGTPNGILTGAGDAQANENQEFSLSTAKISLPEGNSRESYLTFLFSTKNVKTRTELELDLDYTVSYLENDIVRQPGDEYEASQWLAFVVAPQNEPAGVVSPLVKPLGRAKIPVLLRAYPTPPVLLRQDGIATLEAPEIGCKLAQDATPVLETEKNLLEAASEWNYFYTYSQEHAAQDIVFSQMEFNHKDDGTVNASLVGARDLFQDLAQFGAVYALIADDLRNFLLQVDGKSKVSDEAFKKAAAAVKSLKELVANVADALSVSNLQAANAPNSNTVSIYKFSIAESRYTPDGGPEANEDQLLLTINPPAVNLLAANADLGLQVSGMFKYLSDEISLPLVTIDPENYAPELLEGTDNQFRYRNCVTRQYLSFEEALGIPQRTVNVEALNALNFQNAWAAIWLTRNENISDKWQTAEAFTYRTPAIYFANRFTPLLDFGDDINIATLDPKLPQQKTLAAQLALFFKTLLEPAQKQQETLKLEALYTYKLHNGTDAPWVTLPILLATPFVFEIPGDYNADCADAPGNLVCRLAGTLKTWASEHNPAETAARFLLDVTVFSDMSQKPLPLLRTRRNYLEVADITDMP